MQLNELSKIKNINTNSPLNVSSQPTSSGSIWGSECISESNTASTNSNVAPFTEGTDKRLLKAKNGKYIDNKLGHLPYKDCKKEDLVKINGMEVHQKTADSFSKMQKAAAKDGINLRIVSGFRSTQRQVKTFAKKFPNGDIKYATDSEIKNRARWSAPPGYSEHHTGLAIDINSTESSFADTKAFKWLKEHADEYGFEQSFKENNQQGVGFEPWHWRYQGDDESKEVFKSARELM